MTIYTKQNTLNEEKKGENAVELDIAVTDIPEKKDSKFSDDVSEPEFEPATEIPVRQLRKKRRRLCIQFCLLMGIVLGLSVCILGSLYLWRKQSSHRYTGWCGVKYSPKHKQKAAGIDTTAADSSTPGMLYLDEKVDVDVDKDVETLEVPKFDDNDVATFVHDFGRNITVIQDISDSVCYILPLDREKIPVPSTFMKVLYSLMHGEYVPQAEEIAEDYGVVKPAILPDDVYRLYGEYIGQKCQYFDTYKLKRRAPADILTTTTASPSIHRKFIMFPGGEFVIQYQIEL